NVVDLDRMRDDAPGVGEIAVLAGERRAVGYVVFELHGEGIARAGAGIDLVGERIADRVVRIEVADLAVGTREIALIGRELVVESGNEVAGENLGKAHAVDTVIGALVERRVIDDEAVLLDVAEDLVPAAPVAHGDRGQIAEHVLAHGVVGRIRLVVRLDAVDESGTVGRLAVQILGRHALLGALLAIGAGGEEDVDRGAGDHVLIVVG